MSLSHLLELHRLAVEASRRFDKRRDLYGTLVEALDAGASRHFFGITGPRGAGKTVLLRQFAREHDNAFYLSADTLDLADDPWALLRSLHRQFGFDTFLLDEIHYLPEPAALLKQVYDFLDVRVAFTSSVALAMETSTHDLSRRVRLHSLGPFSYREYLHFANGLEVPRLDFTDLCEKRWLPEHLRAGGDFEAYLRGGMLPFALDEPEPLPLLRNTLTKVVRQDLTSVTRLGPGELPTVERLLQFIGRSAVEGLSYSSLAKNLGLTKYKAEQYVTCLEKAFVLQPLFPAGTNVLREPKVLMAPPCRLLFRDYQDALGGLREDFAAAAIQQAGFPLQYLKSTRGAKTPDFLIESGGQRWVIEIGGKGKGRTQFKGVVADHKLVFAHTAAPKMNSIPLFLLGFLA